MALLWTSFPVNAIHLRKPIKYLSSLFMMHRYILFFLLLCAQLNAAAQAEFQSPQVRVEYDSAVTACRLQLIPLKRIEPMLPADTFTQNKTAITLKQGMQQKTVRVKEHGNYMVDDINWLLIENKSGKDVLIKSGEMVTGGRQDRVFARDTVLSSSNKAHKVPVYCIEEERWSKTEKKFVHRGPISSGLQKIIDSAHSQTKVWDEIRKLLKQNNQTSSSSYAFLLNNKKITDTAFRCNAELFQKLRMSDSSYVGFIAVTGNKILGAEVFINSSLFYQTLPQLLEKYGTEAAWFGSTPLLNKEDIKTYADELLLPSTQTDFINKQGKRFFYRSVLIQLSSY